MGIESYVFEPAESIAEVYFNVGGSLWIIGPRPCLSVGKFQKIFLPLSWQYIGIKLHVFEHAESIA